MNVFLDDDLEYRKTPNEFVRVTNYEECVALLNDQHIHILSLDHDLGTQKTGYDVAKYIVEKNSFPDIIYLHTANPVGRENMYQLLEHYKPKNVQLFRHPFEGR